MQMNNNLNECIVSVIIRNGYTIETLSDKLGMSHDKLVRILESPSYRMLEKIAEVLGVELWELLEN